MRTIWVAIASIVFAGIAATPLSAEAREPVRNKVVGGEQARVADWPGIAAIGLRAEDGETTHYFCGGTVIAPTWVLTAAHCLHNHTVSARSMVNASDGALYPAMLIVTPGVQDLTRAGDGDHLAVTRTIIHPVYLEKIAVAKAIDDPEDRAKALDNIALNHGHDIALLELAEPWQGPLARLSLAPETDPADDTRVRVAGFGYTESTMKSGSKRYNARDGGEIYAGSARLLQAGIGVIPTPDCAAHYQGHAIGAAQICAGLEEGGRDSCNGDSGGPLVAYGQDRKAYQVGLVSWGKSLCASSKSYGVYSRISAFGPWLKTYVPSLKAFPPALVADKSATALSELELDEAVSQLQAMFKASGSETLSLRLQGPRPIRLGDDFSFVVHSPVAGRLLIFDINAEGKVTLIFPNRFTRGVNFGRIKAGETLTIPGPGYGFTSFEAQEPVGPGRLIAIVVPDDFDLESAALPPALSSEIRSKGFAPVNRPTHYFMRFILQLERTLRSADAAERSGSEGDGLQAGWALSIVDYEISR
ncbi:MAG: trypsin-like serine protease [Pseudomonadota bacterium]